MKRFTWLLYFLFPLIAGAQDYNVNLIPDSLKINADAVKRFEELKVIILSIDRAVIRHKYAFTILNENGDTYAQYVNFYDKFQSLKNIDGNLFDASGKKLKSVKKKDIADVSYDDDESLVTDTRLKKHNFYYRSYPYTIEYEDEEELDGIFFLPGWQPLSDENLAVQQSRYIVQTPLNYDLRLKQFNYNGKQGKVTSAKEITYSWEVNNVKSITYEAFQPSLKEVTTNVLIAPAEFSIGGYKGYMSSWKDLGMFIETLNKGRDDLPDNVKQDVHKLVDGIENKQQKVKLLYGYLQRNTRYIGIQLGIGSWQPFDARYVASKKYGDCKALSNFMKSLLKEAGIPGYYVLINAGGGRNGLWEDFPAPYFNHAIVCVPDGKDSLWLECTNQTVAAGFMGSSTGNRRALLIAEDGGHIVNTPFYTAGNNLQIRKISATIDEEGNLNADIHTRFTGIQQELQHSLMYDASKEQREKYLNTTLNLPTYKVDEIRYKEDKDIIPVIEEDLRITSSNYANITGKRLFIRPNVVNRSSIRLAADEARHFDIAYTYSFKDIDSIEIILPPKYYPESVPEDVIIKNRFGYYSIIFKVNQNKITVIRNQARNAEVYPASDYPELVKFYDTMFKADRKQIVFLKKEE